MAVDRLSTSTVTYTRSVVLLSACPMILARSSDGMPTSYIRVLNVCRNKSKRLDFLRHANASLLINMGVPVKVISEHLGHSDTRTTETIYAHVFAETMVQASNAISEALATADV